MGIYTDKTNVDQIEVEKITERHFSDLLASRRNGFINPRLYDGDELKDITESFDVAQGKLCMGFSFTKPVDYFVARLFNVIFGGSPTSKLFMNVREKMSLCYYCSSVFDPYVQCFFVSSGIESSNFELAKNEIIHQLNDMKSGLISKEEFENAKLYLLDFINGIKDSHSLLISDKLRNYLLGQDFSLEEQIEAIQSVSFEQIVEAANATSLETIYFLKGCDANENGNA